jgi:hypothetical protein
MILGNAAPEKSEKISYLPLDSTMPLYLPPKKMAFLNRRWLNT